MDNSTKFTEPLSRYIHVLTGKDDPGTGSIASDQSIDTIGMTAAVVVLIVMLLTSFIFIGIGAALLLGRIFGDLIAGFLIVALCQLAVGMSIWRFRHGIWEWLKKSAMKEC